jgi:O-antigen biosynthesis protein WbqV
MVALFDTVDTPQKPAGARRAPSGLLERVTPVPDREDAAPAAPSPDAPPAVEPVAAAAGEVAPKSRPAPQAVRPVAPVAGSGAPRASGAALRDMLKRFAAAYLTRGNLADLVLAAFGMWLGLTFAGRWNGENFTRGDIEVATALFTLIAMATLPFFGTARTVWSWTTADDLRRLAQAIGVATLAFLALLFVNVGLSDGRGVFAEARLTGIPPTVVLFSGFVTLAVLAGARGLVRNVSGGGWRALFHAVGPDAPATILVGPTESVTRAIHAARTKGPLPIRPVAIVSTLGNQIGKVFAGARVHGGLESLEPQVRAAKQRNGAVRIALVGDDPGRKAAQVALSVGARLNVPLMRLPEMPGATLAPVHPSDVLGRMRKELDPAPLKSLIEGKRVLVTGAGGTIGGELSHQIAKFEPERLILVELSENNLYQISCDLADDNPGLDALPRLMDVCHAGRVEALFAAERPQLVLHAAANKHVPLMEEHVCEAILVNLGGTKAVADAALKAKVEAFVFVSTDKAVAPSNVMGAAKRAGELYTRHCARLAGGRFHAVRFGNVLGSSGSVMPRFERQIAHGGPITITHPEMKRWFMTPEEASSLVLQAAAVGAASSSPDGGLFVLDMGDPVMIRDLAEAMVRMKGLEPDVDVLIVETGLRAGEKLTEALFYASEDVMPTAIAGISIAIDRTPLPDDLPALVDAALAAAARDDAPAALAALRRLVPEFQP